MIDPAKLLTLDMRPLGVLPIILGAAVLLILSVVLYGAVSAWLDFMVEALDPGLVLLTSRLDEASIAGVPR